MQTVNDLLRHKGTNIWRIHPKADVLTTLKLMTEKDVGALPVMNEEGLQGIISERDIVHMIAEGGKCDLTATIDAFMTSEVITTTSKATLEECMLVMTEKRIRHLPVVEDGHLIGLISIGDVVKNLVTGLDTKIDQLENYIEGRGYGR
jgi:CBS domain-containing protein